MSIFLSKVLSQLLLPVGLTIALAVFGWLCLVLGLRRLGRASVVAAIGVLWAASTPIVGKFVYGELESVYPPVEIADSPTAEAAIVLGGVLGQPLPPRYAPDLSDAADRVVHAARLFRASKVQYIVVAGGNLPWHAAVKPEGLLIADWLVELGVPASAIRVETESRNTQENAANTKRLMDRQGIRSALLVTSAFHMPRALAVFQKAGVPVTPSSTDVAVTHGERWSLFDWLPDVGALQLTTVAMKEWMGMLVYGWRGWL